MENSYALMAKTDKELLSVAYLRVSTRDQAEDGYSLYNQRKSIKEYARNKGLILEEGSIFEERKPASQVHGYMLDIEDIMENFSNRPVFTEVLKLAQNKLFKHLIVYSRDRLTRETQDSIGLELFFKRFDIKVHYVREGEAFKGLNSSVKSLLDIVFSSISEMEVNILSSRVRDGMKACILSGKWTGGKAPFGYVAVRNKDETKTRKKWVTELNVSEIEGTIVKRVFELYTSGLGYRSVAKMLNKEFEFIEWTKSKVENIIKNEIYTGCAVWDRRGGRRNPNKHNDNPIKSTLYASKEIIDKELWNNIQIERNFRTEKHDKSYYSTNYILKDKVLCPGCKRPMKAKNPGRNKTPIYFCSRASDGKSCGSKVNIPCTCVDRAFIQKLRIYFSENINMNEIMDTIDKKLENRINKRMNIIKKIEDKINEKDSILKKIDENLSANNDDDLIYVLNMHYIKYDNLIKRYKTTKLKLEELNQIDINSRSELKLILPAFVFLLFNNDKLNDVKRIWREFIIKFINFVDVDYNKQNKEVVINNIDFLPA